MSVGNFPIKKIGTETATNPTAPYHRIARDPPDTAAATKKNAAPESTERRPLPLRSAGGIIQNNTLAKTLLPTIANNHRAHTGVPLKSRIAPAWFITGST